MTQNTDKKAELQQKYSKHIEDMEQLANRIDVMVGLVEERLQAYITKNKTLPSMPDIIDSLTNLYKVSKDTHDAIVKAIRDYLTKLAEDEQNDASFQQLIALLEQADAKK